MFNLAIDSKLRGCDVVGMKVEDVAPTGYALARATVRQRKTGHPVRFELTEQTRQAVDTYMKEAGKRPGEFLWVAQHSKISGRRSEKGQPPSGAIHLTHECRYPPGTHVFGSRGAVMDMPRRLGAELLGTFWLTFAGCGSAVLAAGFPELGIGFLGVSFAFGLTVLTMAYAVGHISGGHFNCAVTIGLWAGGRFKARDVVPYVIAQVVGAILAAAILYLIASGKPDWVPGGFASNGYGALSPGKYSLVSCFLIEVIATFFFLYVIIGTTSKGAAVGFAGIPIGLCLTLIHLFLIPVTNASVNQRRRHRLRR
jgi:aquaporin Z